MCHDSLLLVEVMKTKRRKKLGLFGTEVFMLNIWKICTNYEIKGQVNKGDFRIAFPKGL